MHKNLRWRGKTGQTMKDLVNKSYSQELQEDLEPILSEEVAITDWEKEDWESVNPITVQAYTRDDQPIYNCKFWIYEEQRLASYDEYLEFYKRLEKSGNN